MDGCWWPLKQKTNHSHTRAILGFALLGAEEDGKREMDYSSYPDIFSISGQSY